MIRTRWIVALTGASGIRYGLRLVDVLSSHIEEVHVIFSDAALRVLLEEEEIKISHSNLRTEKLWGDHRANIIFHHPRNIGAVIASGSEIFDGMAIVPCSMATLGAIATGTPQNLIHRAADVTLKEHRKLIVVPRETPLSAIHMENMLRLSKVGAIILPAMPGFYHQPSSIADLVDMLVMKILDQMRIPNDLVSRWGQKGRLAADRFDVDPLSSCDHHPSLAARSKLVGLRKDG